MRCLEYGREGVIFASAITERAVINPGTLAFQKRRSGHNWSSAATTMAFLRAGGCIDIQVLTARFAGIQDKLIRRIPKPGDDHECIFKEDIADDHVFDAITNR